MKHLAKSIASRDSEDNIYSESEEHKNSCDVSSSLDLPDLIFEIDESCESDECNYNGSTNTGQGNGESLVGSLASSSRNAKKVSFNANLRVVLIPSIVDYYSAGLKSHLWWEGADYKSFQASAFSELKLLSVFEGIDFHSAKKILYQPCQASSCTIPDCCNIDAVEDRTYSSADDPYLLSSIDSKDIDGSSSICQSEDALSLCVPLNNLQPLPDVDKARYKRNLRKRPRLRDLSIGVASVIALGLLLIPIAMSSW